MILPLFFAYEIMALIMNEASRVKVKNLADVLLDEFIERLGVHSPFVVGTVLTAALLLAIFLRRRNTAPLRLEYFFLIVIESAFYATFMGFVAARITSAMLLSVLGDSGKEQIMLAFGAGAYEELIFRALFFNFTAETLVRVLRANKWAAIIVAALFSSVLFSLAHYLSGETFATYSFFFRFLIGIFFCALYLARGLGVAAWTHVFYDLFIVING